MLRVGLTGGIGCGKSRVSLLFEKLGAPVIDADQIAHRLVEPRQPALNRIIDAFGIGFLKEDGTLDRAKLRHLVFNDSLKKRQLEEIMHPLVFEAIQAAIETLKNSYCIVCVPLLLETGMSHHIVDRILVVDCPESVQIDRVKQRDNLSEDLIQAIINSQISRAERLAQADDIIDNSEEGGGHLSEQVEKLDNFYRSISASLR